MDVAKELFEKLQSFNNSDTPETDFLKYCKNTLGAVERVHFDFKEKQDTRDSNLSESDKKNLAKAVSGFANSGGGVLIWGIEDEAMSPKPITHIEAFVASILGLVSQITDPIVPYIDGNRIPCEVDNKKGYGFIFIPESLLPPHRVILKIADVKDRYFIRSGSSFGVASHTQLEDMFGRRPKAVLRLSKRIVQGGGAGEKLHIYIYLGLENIGRGTAKSPHLSVRIEPPYHIYSRGIDGNGYFGLQPLTLPIGSNEYKYGSSANEVIHPGVALDVTVIRIDADPRERYGGIFDLNIKYKIAAEGVNLFEGEETITPKQIWEAIQN